MNAQHTRRKRRVESYRLPKSDPPLSVDSIQGYHAYPMESVKLTAFAVMDWIDQFRRHDPPPNENLHEPK